MFNFDNVKKCIFFSMWVLVFMLLGPKFPTLSCGKIFNLSKYHFTFEQKKRITFWVWELNTVTHWFMHIWPSESRIALWE